MFKCDECDKEFPKENQLKAHKIWHRRNEKSLEKPKKRERRRRVPLGVPRQKLTVENRDPGKVYRWLNDISGRLHHAQEGGYGFVDSDGHFIGQEEKDGNQDMGRRVSKVVGTTADGQPLRAYLMAIDKDLYEEDQKEKQKVNDRVDDAIRRGKMDNELGEHGYVDRINYAP